MLQPSSEPGLEAKVVAFGPFQVDVRTGEVRKHGYKVKLQDQPFRVLEILLQRPQELVTREELQRLVWPADTFVDFDRGLNNAIKRLRDALGDSAENPQFVETVARRGYRFIGAVKQTPNGSVVQSEAAPTADVQQVRTPDLPRSVLTTKWGWILAIAVLGATIMALQFRRSGRMEPRPPGEIRTQKVIAASPEDSVEYAAISPDGRNIAYVDPSGIHVRVIGTGETRTILPPVDSDSSAVAVNHPGAAAHFPISWYPDGTTLLVSTATPTREALGPVLWSISLLTGNTQKLYEGAWGSSVSPDGTIVAAVKNQSEIWLMGPHGELPHRFTSVSSGNEIGRVIWSPDSKRVVFFQVLNIPGRLECALESAALDDARPIVLISGAKVCSSQQRSSAWLPDNRLTFPLAKGFTGREFDLWQLHVDPVDGRPIGQAERLTNWPGSCLEGVTASVDGKRLAFTRNAFHTSTTIGDIDPAHFGSLTNVRPLANDTEDDWPTAWTEDSKAVIFYSVKDGDTDIFEQPLDQGSSKPLVTGPGEQLAAVATPDGRSFIYMNVQPYQTYGLPNPVELMKIPRSGGTPTLVLRSDKYDSHSCARAPSALCVISEQTGDGHIVLSSFDPAVDGGSERGPKLATIEYGTYWAISPDGSTLATTKPEESELKIRFMSLSGGPTSELTVQGWANPNSLHWAADGRSLYISTRSAGDCTLLQVDLRGVARAVTRQPGAFQMWALPSPDGRHMAIFSASVASEVWTAENF